MPFQDFEVLLQAFERPVKGVRPGYDEASLASAWPSDLPSGSAWSSWPSFWFFPTLPGAPLSHLQ